MREVWNDLLVAAEPVTPFLSWEWLYTWWDHYGQGEEGLELAIIVGRRQGDVVAILPGYTHAERILGRRRKVFSLLGSAHESSDYLDVIGPVGDAGDTLQQLLEFLVGSERELGMLSLDNLLPESRLLCEILAFASGRGLAVQRSHVETAPFIRPAGTFEDYVQANFDRKKELDRKSRRMTNRFDATIGLLTDRTELRQAIDDLFELHLARLSSRDRPTRFAGNRRAAFHRRVGEVLFDAEMLRLFQVKVESVTVATVYAFEFKNELFAYQTGMDPGWKSHSPLFVLWAEVIRYAFDNDLSRLDFMRGTQSYKLEWTEAKRDMYKIDIALDVLGAGCLRWRKGLRLMNRTLRKFVPDPLWRKMRKLGGR